MDAQFTLGISSSVFSEFCDVFSLKIGEVRHCAHLISLRLGRTETFAKAPKIPFKLVQV